MWENWKVDHIFRIRESFLKKGKKEHLNQINQYIEKGHAWQGGEPAKYEALQDWQPKGVKAEEPRFLLLAA